MTTLIWITCGLIAIVFWMISAYIIFSAVFHNEPSLAKRVENATVTDLLMTIFVIANGPISLMLMLVITMIVFIMLFDDVVSPFFRKKLFKKD